MLNIIDEKLNTNKLINEFLNSLNPGEYRWGMIRIRIDKFLGDEVSKTDFYIEIEERIKQELNITENSNHWEYPLVIINDKIARISDLNRYSLKEIKSIDILKSNNSITSIYGSGGGNGVILLKTK